MVQQGPLPLTKDEKTRGWEIREIDGTLVKVLEREDSLVQEFLESGARREIRTNPLLAALRRALNNR